MKCPRCDAHVMPGMEECMACGASMSEPPPAPLTYPKVGGSGSTDLLERKKSVAASLGTRARAVRRIEDAIGNVRGDGQEGFRERLEQYMPPFRVAASGMLFGPWFFLHGRPKEGLAFLLATSLLVAAGLAQMVFHVPIPGYPVMVLFTLLAAGFEATRLHLEDRGHSAKANVAFMSAASAVMVISLPYLAADFLISSLFPNRFLVINDAHYFMDVRDGDRVFSVPVDFGRDKLERGALLYRAHNIYRIIALEGDVVEVDSGVLYINDEIAPEESQPYVPAIIRDITTCKLAPTVVPEGEYAFLQEVYFEQRGNYSLGYLSQYDNWMRIARIYWPLYEWRKL